MWLKLFLSTRRSVAVAAVVVPLALASVWAALSIWPYAANGKVVAPVAEELPPGTQAVAALSDSHDSAISAAGGADSSATSSLPARAAETATPMADSTPSATPAPAPPPTSTPVPPPTSTPEERAMAANRGGRESAAAPSEASPGSAVEQSQLPSLVGKRVGLQVGHWQCADLPSELASLRSSTGASSGGYREVDLNLKVAQLVADILRQQGIQVDVLPATIPVKYKADAFVAIHADANASSRPRGFKAARSPRSLIPAKDDALVAALYDEYIAATGFPRSTAITNNMLYYYAFASSRIQHSVDGATPAAIVETGYLTNPTDRALMLNSTDVVASGIARGIMRFLSGQ